MTERYFTDEQLEQFLSAYLKRYPDALERMHAVMLNPFGDNDELIARNLREMAEVAQTLDFYREIDKKNARALFHIRRELLRKVSSMIPSNKE